MYDWAAIVADFEAFLIQDGRSSHGTDFLTRKLAELRARHRIDEATEAAVLRRFGDHLHDVFLGLVPRSTATADPLTPGDPDGTPAAMTAGAESDHPHPGGDVCPPTPQPRQRPPAWLPAAPRPAATRPPVTATN